MEAAPSLHLYTCKVFLIWQMIAKCEVKWILMAGVSAISTLLRASCGRCWILYSFCSMHQLPCVVLMRVTHSTAVQIGKGCRLYFSCGNSSWSNRLQRRWDKGCVEGECSRHDMGNYELQYGEGEVFEAVLPNGSTLHICIQFSMLHFKQSSWWC